MTKKTEQVAVHLGDNTGCTVSPGEAVVTRSRSSGRRTGSREVLGLRTVPNITQDSTSTVSSTTSSRPNTSTSATGNDGQVTRSQGTTRSGAGSTAHGRNSNTAGTTHDRNTNTATKARSRRSSAHSTACSRNSNTASTAHGRNTSTSSTARGRNTSTASSARGRNHSTDSTARTARGSNRRTSTVHTRSEPTMPDTNLTLEEVRQPDSLLVASNDDRRPDSPLFAPPHVNTSDSESDNADPRPDAAADPQAPWKWHKTATFTPKNIPFSSEEKILLDMTENPSEIDFVNLYLTDSILELMATETNRYANQFINENKDTLKEHSNALTWEPTSVGEMRSFLGLVVLMGIVYKPRISMYWSKDELYNTPIFSEVMTRDRFLLLAKFLHFADNSKLDIQDPHRDRLFKIREFCNMVRSRCKAVFQPGVAVCIDESLVLFKGRLGFKQYIRTKRARFGVKYYMICSSDGVMLDFRIYHGEMNAELLELPKFSTTEKIALTLIHPYMGVGRCLYIDNFYTTPNVAVYLLDNQTKLSVQTERTSLKIWQALCQKRASPFSMQVRGNRCWP